MPRIPNFQLFLSLKVWWSLLKKPCHPGKVAMEKYTIVFECNVIIKGGGEVEGVPDFFYCPILHPDSDRKRI